MTFWQKKIKPFTTLFLTKFGGAFENQSHENFLWQNCKENRLSGIFRTHDFVTIATKIDRLIPFKFILEANIYFYSQLLKIFKLRQKNKTKQNKIEVIAFILLYKNHNLSEEFKRQKSKVEKWGFWHLENMSIIVKNLVALVRSIRRGFQRYIKIATNYYVRIRLLTH